MKILITGSNGFLGNAISKHLKKIGNTIIGIGTKDNNNPNIDNYLHLDISSDDFVEKAITEIVDCNIIIHTAANLSRDNYDNNLITVNCIGTNNIVALAKKIGCKKLIQISSIPIIGRPIEHPISESHPIKPESLYHTTKFMQELLIEKCISFDCVPVNLRIPSPVGIGMNPKTILPIFLKLALENKDITLSGNGTREQNYVNVKDIALAIEKCIEANKPSLCYNVASETTISNYDLAKLCINLTNSTSKILLCGIDKEEGLIWDISIKKIKYELGFKPYYDIKKSIEEILK